MKKLQFLLVLLVVLQTSFVAAQKVSNIAYRQEQSNIIVSYDLETKSPCKVNLFVSTNGGTTWQGPLTKVSGDVGAKIASGSHSITWKVLEEFEELRGDKIQFQVRAYSEDLKSIVIGTQSWANKNLNVELYSDGTEIPQVTDPTAWAALTTGAWCYYDNDTDNGEVYGKLYNWYAVAGIWNESSRTDMLQRKKLAPIGYHIPSDDEWRTLTYFLGGYDIAGGKMKEIDTTHWSRPNKGATNKSGFTALPGGCRYDIGTFSSINYICYWWSYSLDYNGYKANVYNLYHYSDISSSYQNNLSFGYSVRCIKD
jgi:uncharacterized protein (TIGR02145 family)